MCCPVPFPVVRARLVETVLPWARRKPDASTRPVSLVPPCDLSTEQVQQKPSHESLRGGEVELRMDGLARHDTGRRGWGARACLRLLRGAGGIAVMPLAHPLACACLNSRADRQAKFRDTSYADERRSVVVNRQGPRAQEPASWSHVLRPPCPQPRRIDIIAQGLSQPHWTTIQTPPTPSQHPANTSQQHQPLHTPPSA